MPSNTPRVLVSPAEKAHDSRGMDVMGTLDLSIQGWFINPDDIVRTFCRLLVALPSLHGHLVKSHPLRAALPSLLIAFTQVLQLDGTCRKFANERMAATGCWEQVLVHC